MSIIQSTPIITYVASLGRMCHTATFLKSSNLKKCSYPFDWIFSTPDMIVDVLTDDFKKFLDRKNYIPHKNEPHNSTIAGHKLYNPILFNHHNPRLDQDYNYFTRCVGRFRTLLSKVDTKLFIVFYRNGDKYGNKETIYRLNRILAKKTTNYHLLIIQHSVVKVKPTTTIKSEGNICFMDFTSLTPTNGVRFDSENDNIRFSEEIYKLYKFEISDDIKE